MCHTGHGRLHAKIPRKFERINAAVLSGAPVSKKKSGHHEIAGLPGKYLAGAIYRSPIGKHRGDGILAIDGDNIREFTECH